MPSEHVLQSWQAIALRDFTRRTETCRMMLGEVEPRPAAAGGYPPMRAPRARQHVCARDDDSGAKITGASNGWNSARGGYGERGQRAISRGSLSSGCPTTSAARAYSAHVERMASPRRAALRRGSFAERTTHVEDRFTWRDAKRCQTAQNSPRRSIEEPSNARRPFCGDCTNSCSSREGTSRALPRTADGNIFGVGACKPPSVASAGPSSLVSTAASSSSTGRRPCSSRLTLDHVDSRLDMEGRDCEVARSDLLAHAREDLLALAQAAQQAAGACRASAPLAATLRGEAARELAMLEVLQSNAPDDDSIQQRVATLRASVAQALKLLREALACVAPQASGEPILEPTPPNAIEGRP